MHKAARSKSLGSKSMGAALAVDPDLLKQAVGMKRDFHLNLIESSLFGAELSIVRPKELSRPADQELLPVSHSGSSSIYGIQY